MTATTKRAHPAITPAMRGVLISFTGRSHPGTSVLYKHSPELQLRKILSSPNISLMRLFISGSWNLQPSLLLPPSVERQLNDAGPLIAWVKNSLISTEPSSPQSIRSGMHSHLTFSHL